jgi:hypothetical protein
MEHRWSTRRPYRCSVVVHHDATHRTQVHSGDIGPDGMFLETGDLFLPVNTLVTVSFRLGQLDLHLSAVVVHRLARGVGLMFLETDGDSPALRAALGDRTFAPGNHAKLGHRDAA